AFVARLVFRLLGREDEVDDVVQDVFVSLFGNLKNIRRPEALRGWLATTTVRMARRRLRLRRIGFLLGRGQRVDPNEPRGTWLIGRRSPGAVDGPSDIRKGGRGRAPRLGPASPRAGGDRGGGQLARLLQGDRQAADRGSAAEDQEGAGPMTDPELDKVVVSARRAGLPWSAARQQRVSWAVMSRLEKVRRRRPLIALACAGALAAAAGAFVWQRRNPGPSPATTAALAAPGWQLASSLADGTRIVRDDPTTVLRETVEAADDVLFELDAGGARFEVARQPSRVFRVHAGEVTVQVIGTGFR